MFDSVYHPCAEAQEGHPCAIIQLDMPDHRCVVHRVHFRHNRGEKTSAALTVTWISSSPFSSSTVSAVSTSFLLLCWLSFIFCSPLIQLICFTIHFSPFLICEEVNYWLKVLHFHQVFTSKYQVSMAMFQRSLFLILAAEHTHTHTRWLCMKTVL